VDDRICTEPGCDKPLKSRGWCSMHYERWRSAEHSGHVKPRLPCSVDGCDDPVKAHGWCNMHYRRWLKHGDIGGVAPLFIQGDDLARFESHVTLTAAGCWSWTGITNPDGYGVFSTGNRMRLAHRWAYATFVEPIPEDHGLDHLCHTQDLTCPGGRACEHRRCVRPDHLEPVTSAVNTRRGGNARKTHCPNGHPYDEKNTWWSSDGWRQCRTCW
jgi:hypothetical protein